MALDNTTAIVDVVDFEVQDYLTRDLLFSVDYAESVTLKTDAEILEIRGGIGNPVRITTSHSRTAEFNSELPLIDFSALGVKLGRKAVKGAATAPRSEKLVVGDDHEVTLDQTPLKGTLKVYALESNGRDIKNELKVGTPATKEDEYSITDKVITVNTAVTKGTLIKVLYDYTSGANTQLVRVTASDFPDYCRITGTGYALDESGNKSPVAFICYRCKPTPEFEMIFKAGEAAKIPFNCNMAPDIIGGKGVFFDIIPLADEEYGSVADGEDNGSDSDGEDS